MPSIRMGVVNKIVHIPADTLLEPKAQSIQARFINKGAAPLNIYTVDSLISGL